MRTPILTAEQLELIPQLLRDYYELDLLFSGVFADGARWIIGQAGDSLFGPLLGPAFTDAVFLSWPVTPPEVWA